MGEFFFTRLKGANEVPPVNSTAFGVAKLISNRKKTKMNFHLEVNNIKGFIQAHIHFGEKGENGPILVFLFGADAASILEQEGITTRKGVVTGIITNDDIVDNNVGVNSLSDLIKLMKNEKAYVNVHTEQNLGGEIRGQIKRVFPLEKG
jgi:hypothetical protein